MWDKLRNCKIYGPYKNKHGRLMVVREYKDELGKQKKASISYPKWLMEQHLGRFLDRKEETIDHIDGNPLNNDLSNLQIIPLRDHAALDAHRALPTELICIWCNSKFTSSVSNTHSRNKLRKKGAAGPFCSGKCTGQYSGYIKNGGEPLLYKDMPEVTYYTNKKKLTNSS